MYRPAKSTGTRQDDQVVLGDGWKQFAFASEEFEYLGTIRRGMEIGALARDESGSYLQVNGDVQKVLNKSRVTSLLRAAAAGKRKQPAPGGHYKTPDRAAVVVVIKPRRRIPVPPT